MPFTYTNVSLHQLDYGQRRTLLLQQSPREVKTQNTQNDFSLVSHSFYLLEDNCLTKLYKVIIHKLMYGLCHTSMPISNNYTYILSLLSLPLFHPLRSSQRARLGSLISFPPPQPKSFSIFFSIPLMSHILYEILEANQPVLLMYIKSVI